MVQIPKGKPLRLVNQRLAHLTDSFRPIISMMARGCLTPLNNMFLATSVNFRSFLALAAGLPLPGSAVP